MSVTGRSISSTQRPLTTLGALYVLVLRMQLTIPRIGGVGALGALAVVLAALVRDSDDRVDAATELLGGYGLGVVLPLATLWLATASVGDLVSDRLLVYVWLKPAPRWQLPAAAVLATLTVVVGLVGVPLAVAALVAKSPDLAGAALLACALGGAAYAGMFVAAGLALRRALWWGLAWILVWENGIARAGDGPARFSIASYLQSLLAEATGSELEIGGRSPAASVLVPIAVAAAGCLAATWLYRRLDVD